jgi:quinol monooxygenase YgiN
MRQVALILVFALLAAESVFAASASTRIGVQPRNEGSSSLDTTPPVISISKPLIQDKKARTKDAYVVISGKAADASGVSAVTLNNHPATLDESGNFSTELLLKPGENQVTVVATDIYRNTASYKFTVVREKETVAAQIDKTPPVITLISPEVKRGVKITSPGESLLVTGIATNQSGVASVTVNGQPAALDENGNFSAELLLKPGLNKISVTAVDIYKNSATENFSVTRASGKVASAAKKDPAEQPQIGKNYALMIGINRYKNIDPLKTAVKDTEEMAEVLRDVYGFETRMLLNEKATDTAILKELNNLRSKITPADRLIIYYAGHGILDKVTDASYWLPFDAELSDDTNWLDTKRITDQLKRITAKQVLIIADSCYSGAISRDIKSDLLGGETRDNYLKKLQERPSRVLIASGGNEPVADSGGNGHSIFAEVLLNALKNPDRPVFTAGELLTNKVREAVAGRAEQTPEYKIIRNSGHDSGDFIFIKK